MRRLIVLAALLAVPQAQAQQPAPSDLTSRLRAAQVACKRGDARACEQVSLVTGELNSRGFCYGRPGEKLAWERDKTGWVRCR